MAVRYNKLWKILIDKKMRKKDLQEAAHITHCLADPNPRRKHIYT